jgi:putative ABC transport system permease protein
MEVIQRIAVPGYTPQPDERTSVQVNLVGPRYFETEGMILLVGREFGPQDAEAAPHVAIVNEAVVRRFYPGAEPDWKEASLPNAF